MFWQADIHSEYALQALLLPLASSLITLHERLSFTLA